MRCSCDYTHSNKKYITKILKAEANIADCLSKFLCEFLYNIRDEYPKDKATNLIKELLNAYACKEKAMAELIKALNLDDDDKNCCHLRCMRKL